MVTLYAHIFNAPKSSGYKYQLILTKGPSLSSEKEGEAQYSNDKAELKRKAKAAGAKAWNY